MGTFWKSDILDLNLLLQPRNITICNIYISNLDWNQLYVNIKLQTAYTSKFALDMFVIHVSVLKIISTSATKYGIHIFLGGGLQLDPNFNGKNYILYYCKDE